MKKIIFPFALVLAVYFTKAQVVPQAINYQAAARTAQGLIIPDQPVAVRFSILEGSATGTVLYQETATTTTNNFGLFTLAIGTGTPVTGTFAGVNWGNGLFKYLKVEIAPGGGINYTVQGTTLMLSVPYSLYAEKTRLFAGNGISITNGNTIAATYKGTNGVKVSNDTISGNYVAGAGIDITGNVISATAVSNQWQTHANGIYYPGTGGAGRVGIRTTPVTNHSLIVNGDLPGVIEGNAAKFTSTSTWHTDFSLENTSVNTSYVFVVGGSANTELKPRNFGIYNTSVSPGWALNIDGINNNIGIGDLTFFPTAAKSKLHLKTGDIYLEEIGRGIIMKSPNGQCWRITIDNTGNLVRTAITCP